jgi:peptidoglycan/xylan/chitin deacetylase (PgdA/CDA1 family)
VSESKLGDGPPAPIAWLHACRILRFAGRMSLATLGVALILVCTLSALQVNWRLVLPAALFSPAPYPCKGYVGLSFDDGPSNATKTLAAGLEGAGLHATFFVIGKNVDQDPDAVKYLADQGFAIGNHTYNHLDLQGLGEPQREQEILQGSAAIERVTGQRPTLFRPPEGATDAEIRTGAQKYGLTEVLWTTDTNDWKPGRTPQEIAGDALKVDPGGIILMHDFGSTETLDALPLIADGLRARGLCTGQIIPSNVAFPVWDGLSYYATAGPWHTAAGP